MDTFTISNLIAIKFLEGSGKVNLGGHKYQHKFLYVTGGSGSVTIDNRVFEFSAQSFYTFRLATIVEIVALEPVNAFLLVFNTTPFRYSDLIREETHFIRRIQIIEKLYPDTPETRAYLNNSATSNDSIVGLLEVIKHEMRLPSEYSNEVIVNNVLSVIYIALRVQPLTEGKETYIERSPDTVQMMRVSEHMLNENSRVTIGDVARKLELSEYALKKIFIKHSGITFANFLRNTRNRYARS